MICSSSSRVVMPNDKWISPPKLSHRYSNKPLFRLQAEGTFIRFGCSVQISLAEVISHTEVEYSTPNSLHHSWSWRCWSRLNSKNSRCSPYVFPYEFSG